MTDVPSSLGIEAVECFAEDARPPRHVTVRVTGRWRRRRPELRGQPMLVVDTASGRQRFLAMPEPPSLTGAPPGTWRMSFSVPAPLAPSLPGRTFLQLGGAMVPLPVGDVPIPAEPVEAADDDLLEARRARGSELAAASARRQATDLAADLARLERELAQAHAQSERLRAEIADRERRLRLAEQHAHAERALRAEVEEDLSRRSRAAEHDLRVLHERLAELEGELTRMRRAVDEAQHLAAAAEAARAEAVRAEAVRRPAEPAIPSPRAPQAPQAPQSAPSPRAGPTSRELELARGSPGAPPAGPAPRPAARAGDREALRHEAAMSERRRVDAGADGARLAALERELAAAHEEIETQRRRSARAYEAIELVRGELRQLRATAVAPQPPSRRAPPAEPVEVGLVRAEPVQVGPVRTGPVQTEPVQAERLSAALARLRDQGPAAPTEDAARGPDADAALAPAAAKPWLSAAFRTLAAQDPATAGRLLLGLLPAQRAAGPGPVAYDLVMSDVLVAHVTVGSAAAQVESDATTRPLAEVDFQVVGGLARIARLLAAGPVRRRLGGLAPGRRLARVRGDRRRLAALDGLLGARLTIAQLHAAGVRLDPLLATTLAALIIEPGWTAGERFTLAHRETGAAAPGAHLLVRDGRPPLALGEPPHGAVATVVVCPADQLLAVLGGAAAPAEVVGEERPLALVGQWLDRAQSG